VAARPDAPRRQARRLGIHRNTLSYRLEKIAEIGGFDPKDPSEIFAPRICLTLRDLHADQPFRTT
jgi:carbohydrate diacid regulator